MRLRKLVLSFGIAVLILHVIALLLVNDVPSSHQGLKGSAWGAGALAKTGFGRLLYVLLDIILIFFITRLWRKK